MSSESDFDPSSSGRSGDDPTESEDDDEPSDEEEECVEKDEESPVIYYVRRGVEFPNPGEGILIVEEDRPEGFHLDEYAFTNVVAYMTELVQSDELVVRREETNLFIEVTRTRTVFQLPQDEDSFSGESMNMVAIFKEFILQGGGNFLADDGLIIWVSYLVPGKSPQSSSRHRRVFMLSELSLEAMRARR